MICPECGFKINGEKCENCGCDKINICLNCLKTFKDSDDFCSDCNLHTVSLKDYLKIKEDLDFANRLYNREKYLGALYAYDELIKLIPQGEFLLFKKGLSNYFEDYDYDALELFNNVLKLNPIHPESNSYKANIIDDLDEDDDPFKYADIAIENVTTNSDIFSIYSNIFQLFIFNSYYDEAEEILNIMKEKLPDEDLSRYEDDLVSLIKEKAVISLKPLSKIREDDLIEVSDEDLKDLKYNFEIADEFYEKLEEILSKSIDEDSIEVLNHKARIFINEEEGFYGQDFINKALEIDDSNLETLYLKASSHYLELEFEEADEYLDKVFKIDENYIEALNLKAKLLLNYEEYDKGLDYANKVLAIDSENLDALANKADAFYFKLEYEKALNLYKKLYEMDSNNSLFKFSLNDCLKVLGREDEIEVEDFPKETKNPFQYVSENYLIYKEDYDTLLDYYNYFLREDPNNSKMIYKKGLALINAGKYEECLKCLDDGLKKDSKNSDLMECKALLFKQQGKYKKALKFINKSLKINPDNFESLKSKALILIDLKRYKSSLDITDKLIEKDDLNEELYIIKAMALLHLFKFDELDECADMLLKINPKNSDGLVLKERIEEIRENFD